MRRVIWVARGSGARRTREKRENCYAGKNVNKRERGRSCCCTRERERNKAKATTGVAWERRETIKTASKLVLFPSRPGPPPSVSSSPWSSRLGHQVQHFSAPFCQPSCSPSSSFALALLLLHLLCSILLFIIQHGFFDLDA